MLIAAGDYDNVLGNLFFLGSDGSMCDDKYWWSPFTLLVILESRPSCQLLAAIHFNYRFCKLDSHSLGVKNRCKKQIPCVKEYIIKSTE